MQYIKYDIFKIMKYNVKMYEKEGGTIPVLEFIQSLQPKQQAKITREIDLLEKFGSDLHYPHIETIKGDKYKDLLELRVKFASNIFRIFFFLPIGNLAILLHGITKKKIKRRKKNLKLHWKGKKII